MVDETLSPNFSRRPGGDLMSEAARTLEREAPTRQDRDREDRMREELGRAPAGVGASPGATLEPAARPSTAVDRQRFVWDNRQFIFRTALAGLSFSAALAFLISPRFESTARLMPPDQGGTGASLAALAAAGGNLGAGLGSSLGSAAGDLLGLKSSSDLFIGILESRTVEDDLIEKFNLRKVYSVRRMQEARAELAKRSNLSVDRKSGILTIEVTDGDPRHAAAMAGEYAAELDRVVTQLNTSSAHREREFLEGRLTEVKEDLESAEKKFSDFAARNTALDVPAQGRALIEAAASLDGQLIAAQTELQGLKQIYADGNVRVRATEARVRELREQLDKNVSGVSATPAIPSSSGTGRGRESLYPSIRELPALGVGYADLYRTTKIQETVFQTLTQEYELAKVQEAKETPSVKILDPPDVPEKKTYPPRLLILLLGAVLSIAASVSWIFAKRAWDEARPEDPQKALALEVLRAIRAGLPWAARNGSRHGPVSD